MNFFNDKAPAAMRALSVLESQISVSHDLDQQWKCMAQEKGRLKSDNVELSAVVVEVRVLVEHMFAVCQNYEIGGRFRGRGRFDDIGPAAQLLERQLNIAPHVREAQDMQEVKHAQVAERSTHLKLPEWLATMTRFAQQMQGAASRLDHVLTRLNAEMTQISVMTAQLQQQSVSGCNFDPFSFLLTAVERA